MNVPGWPPTVRALALGAVTGLLGGGGAFVFLEGLDAATQTRIEQPWLLWFLPLFGLAWGALRWRTERHPRWRRALRGTVVVVEQARQPDEGVPRRQAPLVLVGTWAAHLTGASVGREGVGLQVSASLAEQVARCWRLDPPARRLLLVGAIAGGFGAVFGVPWAGAVFALEVAGRPRWPATRLVTALVAAFVGDAVVRGLGHQHAPWPSVAVSWGPATWWAAVLGAVAFAAVAWGVVTAVESLRHRCERRSLGPLVSPAVGGVAMVGLALLVGRDYLGLSLPLLDAALVGSDGDLTVPLLKAVFTVVALAAGFPGGEVTPLFVIGATLGAAMSTPLGVDGPLLAALGMVGVFAAASGAPLASALIAVELFGTAMAAPALLTCVVASALNRRRRLYPTTQTRQAVASTRMGSRRGPRI